MEKNKPEEVLTKEGKQHFSVGAIIEREGKFLVMERKLPPEGFACVAGHIDEGETPLDALEREVKEETNLDLVSSDLLFRKVITNKEDCTFGVKRHFCYVYDVKVRGKLKPAKREVKSINYMSRDRIKKLYKQKRLEYIWAIIFKKLKII